MCESNVTEKVNAPNIPWTGSPAEHFPCTLSSNPHGNPLKYLLFCPLPGGLEKCDKLTFTMLLLSQSLAPNKC